MGINTLNGGMIMEDLTNKKCVPCSIGADPLDEDFIKIFLKGLKEGQKVLDNKVIEKTFKFKDFKEGLDFTNKVGNLAESEGHHPEITLSWGWVRIRLTTYKIKGLHENDFILAAKIDKIYS